jgi:hypothetical protein
MSSERPGFAPYRIPPGALPEEAARRAAAAGAGPLLARPDDPLPAALLAGALAELPAGMAGAPDEACRAADGTVAGSAEAPRACLNSQRHRARVESAARRALEAGFAGVCLDLPDAPIAAGMLGAGFCADCQRAFARELVREYGDNFQPFDVLSLAREALASASGAVSHERLAFGRELWRARVAWLDGAVGAYARAARDAARAVGRPFQVAARFEAVGPAQLRAARHLDAAVFPVAAQGQASAAGLFRLLRAAMGRRPCAASVAGDGPFGRLASVAASCAVELLAGSPEADGGLAAVRRFTRAAAANGRTALGASPVAECALLYSADSDLWSGGEHREQLEWTGDALAALQVQAPVVLRPSEAPPGAVLVLSSARALSPLEAQEVRRRLEAGSGVLCLGAPGGVDEAGRPAPLPFPPGKAGGERLEKGMVVRIAERAAPRPGAAPETWARAHEDLARALGLLLGRGRRAASTAGRSQLHVALHRQGERLDVHLAALDAEPARGTTLFVGLQVAGEARRGRFKSAGGQDERVPLNPSGYAVSTVLPTFEGYAVLSIPG